MKEQAHPQTEDPPFSLTESWDEARGLFALLRATFGPPGALAARIEIPRALYGVILFWLRPIEWLARRLLLLIAADLPKPAPAPKRRGRSLSMRKAKDAESADPREWSVAFRAMPPKPRPCRRRRPRYSPPSTAPGSARGLARRIEALARVLEDPAPYARRLARKLHALAESGIELTLKEAQLARPWLSDATVIAAQQAAKRALAAFRLDSS